MNDRLLMALVPGDDYWESEPVIVRHFGGDSVSFQLEDGSELVFNRDELAKALELESPMESFALSLSQGRRKRR